MNRAVFLDRDGTINKEVNYLRDPKDLELLPRVSEAIQMLNEAKFRIIIVTNQSGVARGFLTVKRLDEIHSNLLKLLSIEGAKIDALYYCPHRPGDSCECRKPRPGLILKAAKEHDIDLGSSFVIGDKLLDIETGKNAGCKTILVRTGYGEKELRKMNTKIAPDFVADNLYDVAVRICSIDDRAE